LAIVIPGLLWRFSHKEYQAGDGDDYDGVRNDNI